MIISFRNKDTEKIWNQEFTKKYPNEIQRIALRKLLMIHGAYNLNDLKVTPGNKLESLKGIRKGQYSIRINAQWRICFKWEENNASFVEITDYH